jgi:hypothetical protein
LATANSAKSMILVVIDMLVKDLLVARAFENRKRKESGAIVWYQRAHPIRWALKCYMNRDNDEVPPIFSFELCFRYFFHFSLQR